MPTIYERITDPQKHPRLAFLAEYVEGLATIVAVYVLSRVAYAIIAWVEEALPLGHAPNDLHWYYPVNFLRLIVTIVDTVALIFIAITSFVAVIRLAYVLLRPKNLLRGQA